MGIQGIQTTMNSQLLEVGMASSLLQGASSPMNYATATKKSFSFMDALSEGNYSVATRHAVHGLSLEYIVNHLRIKKFMKMLIFYDIIGSFIVCETAKGG